jgi:hypothetical protein
MQYVGTSIPELPHGQYLSWVLPEREGPTTQHKIKTKRYSGAAVPCPAGAGLKPVRALYKVRKRVAVYKI